ncbi:hypothetical protein R1sor_027476 [Riccia sorocarpa]|uniref:Reverse transcriptase domain-containing protein n=1 Tax=Riccia sorocarpa TaxID=122646 RepID=A0ABD3GF23_9MARC
MTEEARRGIKGRPAEGTSDTPENEERQWLKNWRPITLMSYTYKIISKDAKIEDNILTLRMADEWGPISGEENIFIKLDFTKAFDRVSFTYMWHTLRAMGFSEDTIKQI